MQESAKVVRAIVAVEFFMWLLSKRGSVAAAVARAAALLHLGDTLIGWH
jgi:hypothetical protein